MFSPVVTDFPSICVLKYWEMGAKISDYNCESIFACSSERTKSFCFLYTWDGNSPAKNYHFYLYEMALFILGNTLASEIYFCSIIK